MDATPIARPLPDLRLRLLKAAVVIPDLIISSLITFVLLAALPTDVAVGFIAGMLAISIGVASGRGEGVAVRILHAARRPTATDARRIARALQLVVDRSGVTDLRVLIGQGDEPVSAAGRRHVILHREVVDAHRAGRITDAEVAALIAHGVGRLRLGQPRLDLLAALWTLPWDFVRGFTVGIGGHLSWVPLGRLAWQTRYVVGTIAVILESQAERWPSPIIIAAFIALSYVVPRSHRALQQRQTAAADHEAARLGLGGALTTFLRRLRRDGIVADRIDCLTLRQR